jgi:hypothetical protein
MLSPGEAEASSTMLSPGEAEASSTMLSPGEAKASSTMLSPGEAKASSTGSRRDILPIAVEWCLWQNENVAASFSATAENRPLSQSPAGV